MKSKAELLDEATETTEELRILCTKHYVSFHRMKDNIHRFGFSDGSYIDFCDENTEYEDEEYLPYPKLN